MITSHIVGEAEAGSRLDLALATLSGISRSRARRWIDEGRVCVGDRTGRASERVRSGDHLTVECPAPEPSSIEPEPIPLAVLFEDEDVIVIDKPAGLVVHPAPGHARGTLVNALLHHCGDLSGVGDVLRPGIVHRLDRGTSGAMVVAKNDAAHRGLAVQFEQHTVDREYRALVRGLPGTESGAVDRPIGRHPRDRKRMSVRSRRAREAHTTFRVVRRFPKSGRTWLAVRPKTGRTHQIRVHLASIGLPIAGDPVYGRGGRRAGRADAPDRGLSRPALHAAILGFTHPVSGKSMTFESQLPDDLTELLDRLARREER